MSFHLYSPFLKDIYPYSPPAFNQLIIKRKKTQNLKQGKREGREEKPKPHNYSCASMLHKYAFLQKLGQAGWGVLGKEIEEFLRPEKRGKHVTELDESFIRL